MAYMSVWAVIKDLVGHSLEFGIYFSMWNDVSVGLSLLSKYAFNLLVISKNENCIKNV